MSRLRLLHVEDSESDSLLIARHLERAGLAVEWERVESEAGMRAALGRGPWDAILCDWRLPGFDAPRALEVARLAAPDVPLIVVSGAIGEEAAGSLIRAGAHDYVLKDNLIRLPAALDRGIREAQVRRERRLAEEALRESRERLTLAMEATRLGTFDLDPAGGALVLNDIGRRHLGVSPETEVSTEAFERAVHPDDRERVAEVHRQAARPGHDGSYSVEFRIVGIEDGVERWLAASGRVWLDEQGRAVRRVGVFVDGTKRKRAEAELRAALAEAEGGHRLLDAVFRTQTDAVIVWGAEGNVIRTNPAAAAFFGFDPVGMDLAGMVERFRLDGGLESSVTLRALRGETTMHAEQRVGERMLETSSAPMRDDQGAIVGAVTILRDVTERRHAEQRLRQTQKLESIGLLAGGIAHDFNNLLTAVIGNISMVLDDGPLNGNDRSALRMALDSAQRAASLTRQLLAYAGKGAFVREPVAVEDIVESTLQLLRGSAPDRVRMLAHSDEGLPHLLMDPGQLQQIVMNLVLNGVEAIGESGPGVVMVRSRRTGKFVSIEVSDSGCGMEPAMQERIFDPFFTTKFTGRGLGLAAVQGIVRSLDGDIAVDSTPGQGTRMRVLLPAPGGG